MCQNARHQRPNLIRLQGAALVAVRTQVQMFLGRTDNKGTKIMRTATRAAPCSRQTPRVEWIKQYTVSDRRLQGAALVAVRKTTMNSIYNGRPLTLPSRTLQPDTNTRNINHS